MSSKSSGGSEESEPLGVDLPDAGLFTDRVLRSERPVVLEDTDDWFDCELVGRAALDDRRGEGGAIEEEARGDGVVTMGGGTNPTKGARRGEEWQSLMLWGLCVIRRCDVWWWKTELRLSESRRTTLAPVPV